MTNGTSSNAAIVAKLAAIKPEIVERKLLKKPDKAQIRVVMDDSLINSYHKRIEAGSEPPPLAVVRMANGDLIVADGWHRDSALERAGRSTANVVIVDGNDFTVVELATAYNADYGLTLKNLDRRRAATLYLNTPEGFMLSNSEIARRVGLTHPTIADIRNDLFGVTDNSGGLPVELGGSATPETAKAKKAAKAKATPVAATTDEALSYESAPTGWTDPGPISTKSTQPPAVWNGYQSGQSNGSHKSGNGQGTGRAVTEFTLYYKLSDGTEGAAGLSDLADLPSEVRGAIYGNLKKG